MAMDFSKPIDRIHIGDLTKQRFQDEYLKPKKPFIVTGILDTVSAGKLWTLDAMFERLGENKVRVFDKTKANGTSFLKGHEVVPMKTMLELVRNNQESDLRMFVDPVLKNDKVMAAEFPCPEFFTSNFQLPPLLFLGGKGCVVPLHYDFMLDHGILTQLYGRKDIILVEHNQSDLLYRLPFNTTSHLDLFDPDYENYPALHKVKGHKITLNHGDTLFIPSGYWHQLKYVDASMSIAFRMWHQNPLVTAKTALTRVAQISFDKSLQAVLGNKWLNLKKRKAVEKALI